MKRERKIEEEVSIERGEKRMAKSERENVCQLNKIVFFHPHIESMTDNIGTSSGFRLVICRISFCSASLFLRLSHEMFLKLFCCFLIRCLER